MGSIYESIRSVGVMESVPKRLGQNRGLKSIHALVVKALGALRLRRFRGLKCSARRMMRLKPFGVNKCLKNRICTSCNEFRIIYV